MIIEPGYNQPIASANGNPLANGRLHVRAAASIESALIELFRSPEFSSESAAENPVNLNGSGEIPFPVYAREHEAWAFAHDSSGVFAKSWPVYGHPAAEAKPPEESVAEFDPATFSFGCVEPFSFYEAAHAERLVDDEHSGRYFMYLTEPPQKWWKYLNIKRLCRLEFTIEESYGSTLKGIEAYAVIARRLGGSQDKYNIVKIKKIPNDSFGTAIIEMSSYGLPPYFGPGMNAYVGVAIKQIGDSAQIMALPITGQDGMVQGKRWLPLRVSPQDAGIDVYTPGMPRYPYTGSLNIIDSYPYVASGQQLDTHAFMPHACHYLNTDLADIREGDSYDGGEDSQAGALVIPWFSVSMTSWGLND